MNLKKSVILLSVLLVCTGVFAAGKIRLAPGASCYAWNVNTKSKPDSVPNGGFVDESAIFCAGNIRVCEELQQFNPYEGCFIMWEGYLAIPKNGQYRFTWSAKDYSNIKIFLNNSLLLSGDYSRGNKKATVTAAANLKKGFVKIRIYFNPLRNVMRDGNQFILKFGGIKAMKMTDITPATLYHRVEDEN